MVVRLFLKGTVCRVRVLAGYKKLKKKKTLLLQIWFLLSLISEVYSPAGMWFPFSLSCSKSSPDCSSSLTSSERKKDTLIRIWWQWQNRMGQKYLYLHSAQTALSLKQIPPPLLLHPHSGCWTLLHLPPHLPLPQKQMLMLNDIKKDKKQFKNWKLTANLQSFPNTMSCGRYLLSSYSSDHDQKSYQVWPINEHPYQY